MLITEQLQYAQGLSENEKTVAKYLAANLCEISSLSITQIAQSCYVSCSTVVHLSEKLGFKGWKQLRQAIAQEQIYIHASFHEVDPNVPFHKEDTPKQIRENLSLLLADSIADTCSLLDDEQLHQAALFVSKASVVNVYGISFSIEVAQDFRIKMMSIGKTVNVIDNPEEFFYYMKSTDSDTVSILISYSGETRELVHTAGWLKVKGYSTIAITSIGGNSLSKACRHTLLLSTKEKLYSKISTFSSSISIHYVLDVLCACVFALNYDQNMAYRKTMIEVMDMERTSSVSLLKENKIK